MEEVEVAEHTLLETEPALVGEAVRAVLFALSALGWIVLDEAAIAAVVTAVAAVTSLVVTFTVRQKVWAPATVEDLGILDPNEDFDHPDEANL